MQPLPGRSDRTVKLVLAGLALLVLLVVVSFATRSGFGHASASRPTPGYVSWAMSLFLVFFILMIPVAAYSYVLQTRISREQNETRKPMQSRILRTLGVLAAVMLLLAGREFLRRHHALPVVHAPWLHPANGRPGADSAADKPYQPTFQWPVLYIAVALVLAVVAWLWWMRRNAPPAAAAETAELTAAEDVAATISDAIDDLEAEPDARAAVIAAYARMERTFDRRGLERRPSETPVEYLQRILVGLGSRTEPVTRLTGLFEQAKFSDHRIDASMKREAIDALRAIRSDLQAAGA